MTRKRVASAPSAFLASRIKESVPLVLATRPGDPHAVGLLDAVRWGRE